MIRLHLLGVPHTITRDEFSHDAFTGLVKLFSPMMKSLPSFEVYHYGNGNSESGADKEIQILTEEEFFDLRILSYMQLYPPTTYEEAKQILNEGKGFSGQIVRGDVPLFTEFNKKLRGKLNENYRSISTDVVCVPFYPIFYKPTLEGQDMIIIETGVGYDGALYDYRIYPSNTHMHHGYGDKKKDL